MTEPDAAALEAWVREEQAQLWSELANAIRHAINGAWSIAAASVARRIVEAALLVGPTPHGEAPWELVASGVYEAVLTIGGVTPALPDDAEWDRLDELMREHGGTRETIKPRLAPTLAAINSDRERAWIAGADEA